jgi:hypothetical protein
LNGESAALFSLRTSILAPSDVEWLIDRALSGEAKQSALFEASLVRFAFNSSDQKIVAKLWSACQINATLNAECGGFFAQIELDSEAAKILREHFRREKEWTTRTLITPPPSERVKSDLDKIEAGDTIYWVQLTLDLTLEPTSTHYAADAGPDLTDTPGWKAADNVTRRRVLDAAVRYLREAAPHNDEWFRTASIPYAAIGGFRALALLMGTEDARLDALSSEVWAKWVPILLRFRSGVTDEAQLQPRLLRRVHDLLPDETVKWILELIDGENERNGHLFVVKEVDICWNERLGSALLEKSRNSALRPQILGGILELLFERDFPGARESAESRIQAGASGSKSEQDQAVTAAQVLMRYGADAGWAKIWPIIKEKKLIGRKIVESVSYGHAGRTNFITKLNEAELGEFYLWMVEAYPYAEQKLRSGAMGSGDTAAMLRDGVLEHLKQRGTFAACDAIRGLMEKLPQYSWMRHHLEEAESLARTATWSPISVPEFLALALDRDKRLVDGGSQLADAIVESLDRLHVKLHGELPAVRDLWNTPKDGFSPKDEQEVADYIARYLNEDLRGRGIIVNREVQIRRGIGGGTGQRTDIHVDAVAPGGRNGDYNRISAIVEVKGNWNAQLSSAMETQLRDRYLKENQCRNGLYLVAWFTGAKWNQADPRRKQCAPTSLSEAQAFFSTQANELSKGGFWIRSYVLDVALS